MNSWWAGFHFLRPYCLWLLATVPMLYLSFRVRDDVRARWRRYIEADLLEHLIVARRMRLRLRPIYALCAFIAVGALGVAGPSWRREQPPFTEDKAPLVVVLDLSQTMDAIDLNPTRLERAKLKLRDLLKLRDGGRTALFVYSQTAHMVLPFTTDFSLIDLYLSSLSTSLMPSTGKDTGAALAAVRDFTGSDPVPGTVLLVTDGIEPGGVRALKTFTSQEDNRQEILVLAVGTSSGGPIRIGNGGFLSDSFGRRVYARLDVSELRALSEMGVETSMLTLNDDDVRWIQRRVQHHLLAVQDRDTRSLWVDEGYWLTIPLAAIAVLWFRKGWTVRWIAITLVLTNAAVPAKAQPRWSWMDLWLTHDQQGRRYFEDGEYLKAAGAFGDPMWKGLALARAGDFESALNAFALSDSGEAWFNQGNCLAHMGKYPEAAKAYQQALARRHPWSDAEENLALIQALIPKAKKKDKDQQEEDAPNLPPDQVKFDNKSEKGGQTRIRMKLDPRKMAEIWMRNIQTSPADFLRRRFSMQAAQESRHD